MDDDIFAIPLDTTDPKDIEALDRALEEELEKIRREKAEKTLKAEEDSA